MKKFGRKNRPCFRVCAVDIRSPRDGRVIEELGTYDPMVSETDARAILNGERISYWLSVGAQPSPKVATLIKKYGKQGSHLDAQQKAIERLGERRSQAIESARAAAATVPKTKRPEPAAATSEPVSESPVDSSETLESGPSDDASTGES
jgi:small subunit ribosomal protein S16